MAELGKSSEVPDVAREPDVTGDDVTDDVHPYLTDCLGAYGKDLLAAVRGRALEEGKTDAEA